MLLTFEQARRVVEEHAGTVHANGSELCNLLDAAARVLAQAVIADRDLPPFPRAARDGFALRAADVANVPSRLTVIGEVRAGADASEITVGENQCVEIMTGAPVPQGADAVVMVEYTFRMHADVEIQRSVGLGENIVPRGSEARAGQELLRAGTRMTPAAIAAAASVGLAQVEVYRRPQVAILSTGDEIVNVDATPAAHQIRNSNTYSLAAQVLKAGAIPVPMPIAPDEHVRLRELIEEGLNADLLLITGGVSMGKYDLVELVLRELGAEFLFTGAQIQPGKPVVFGRVRDKYFFGLPGNPVSTMVTFELFARAMIEALSGTAGAPLRFLQARLKADIKTKTGLTRFLPAELSGDFDGTLVQLVRWQGSGDIVATSRANCFAVIPPDREFIAAGEMLNVLVT
ncbi:MAG TPA: gephyrin-like molybdotransferase Glp [Terriglobales bacterium]|nr:gephyrin-like molybdotransferase Glp [Terriglobales bacterium]